MRELVACIKKEALELVRRKKLFLFGGVAIGMVPLTLGMLYLMSGLMSVMQGFDPQLTMMFSKSTEAAVMFYNSFIQAYYVLIVIFLLMGTVAKEIKQKKWVLPVCSGISTRNMVAAKFIVLSAAVVLPVILGSMLNLMLGVALFDQTYPLSRLVLSGVGLAVTVLFYTVATIAVSALTKSSLWAALAPIFFLFFFDLIFAGLNISNFTPFLFSNLSALSAQPTAGEWAGGTLITLAGMAALIFFAVWNPKLSIV